MRTPVHRMSVCFLVIAMFAGRHASAAQKAAADKPPCPVELAAITSTDQGVPLVLACEWRDVGKNDGADQALNALDSLTKSTDDVLQNSKTAFDSLRKGAPGFEDLLNAAQGDANAEGQPFDQGYTAILKALAEANTKKPGNLSDSAFKSQLITDATDRIKQIYANHKATIGKVNGLFVQGNQYRALYELLAAYPKCPAPVNGVPSAADDATCRANWAAALEAIRAGYQASADDLAKAVASLVHGTGTN